MNHEAIEELIPAYALGATEPDESAQVEAHLRTCARCRALLADYQLLSDQLLYTVPYTPAPRHLQADLRRRLATPASTRPRLRLPWLRVPAFALVLAAVLLLISNAYWWSRVTQLENQLTLQATAIPLIATGQRARLVGDAPAPQAWGELHFQPQAQVALLQVHQLPPLPPGKVYQLWLIQNGQRDSGGLFRVDERGEGILLVTSPKPLREYDAVGVTVEPEGGSPGPTSPRVIGGNL